MLNGDLLSYAACFLRSNGRSRRKPAKNPEKLVAIRQLGLGFYQSAVGLAKMPQRHPVSFCQDLHSPQNRNQASPFLSGTVIEMVWALGCDIARLRLPAGYPPLFRLSS